MAKFSMHEADNYGSNGGGFFALKNDKDTAVVRFLYNTIEDVEGFAVHEVEVDGKRRYVNCLRSYDEPIENCPFCAAGMKVRAKLFLHLWDEDTNEMKIWDRGKSFFSLISSLCNRYNPLVGTPFEIERNGKKGDTNTTYMPYALQTDNKTLADFPEIPELLGTLVIDPTYEDMEYFLAHQTFPDNGEAEEPVERQPAVAQRQAPQRQAAPQRRTPANQNPAPARRRTPVDKF